MAHSLLHMINELDTEKPAVLKIRYKIIDVIGV